VSSRTRRRSIKNTKTEIWVRIKSIKGTSTVIKNEVKIKTRRKRRIEVGIMILVLITQRNTMKRLATSLITTHLGSFEKKWEFCENPGLTFSLPFLRGKHSH
jgi:hypothetical protein